MDFSILQKLGIDPSKVNEAKSYVDQTETESFYHIQIKAKPAMKCPNCGRPGTLRAYYSRTVRGTINALFPTLIELRIPRYVCENKECEACGRTFSELPKGVSQDHEIPPRIIKAILSDCAQNAGPFKEIAKNYGVSLTTVFELFDKFYSKVDRRKFGKILCIDEIHISKATSPKFATVIVDGETGKLLDMIHGRRKENLYPYFRAIPEEERLKVRYFVSDMYDLYDTICKKFFPNAIHIIDPFHIVKQLTFAMNKSRNKAFPHPHEAVKGQERREYSFQRKFAKLFEARKLKIKNTKVYSPFSGTTIPIREALVECLASKHGLLDLYEAEQCIFQMIDGYTKRSAADEIDWIVRKLRSSGTLAALDAAVTFEKWREDIVKTFELRAEGILISNAYCEGMNNLISTFIKTAHGVRNFERFRKRCLLKFGA